MATVANWWDYPTNFSDGTNAVNNTFALFEYSNYVTTGWFGVMILLMTFGISFAAGILSGVKKAFLAASFVSTIISMWLASLGLISPVWVGVMITLTIISAIGSFYDRGGL